MKHTLRITIYMVILFFMSQVVGLAVVNQYIDHKKLTEGKLVFESLPYHIERPELKESISFAYIFIAILIGTALLLVLIRFKKVRIWKFWYLISVLVTLSISLSAFINHILAFIFALLIAYLKVYNPNVVINNISEVFIYGGLAAIFVPMLNIFGVFALLFLISLYDMYSVWKSKHMISLAKFQTSTNVFAGLSIPYAKSNGILSRANKENTIRINKSKKVMDKKIAVLGGGDIGFPLLFAGVIMKNLMLINSQSSGFLLSLIVPFFATLSLLSLFIKGESNKFYPAMPFLFIGCLAGFLFLKLFTYL